ncbi:MAG TPA: prolyl oligopeptidase family serine peptidase, partial [Steroidobacteraceae bacterium]|nr:prolyl oligopeptidase family serine peptidase [Steroidobacteraceae bacterium]
MAFTLCVCGIAMFSVAGAAAPPPAAPITHVPPSWSGPAERLVNPSASASLSPDGRRAAWSSDDGRSLLSATRSGPAGGWTAPDRLLSTRGMLGKLVFSPDGRRIAYEDLRTWLDNGTATDRWQFIAVYDLATRQIEYLDPAFDVDSDPRWSADSAQITFTRSVDGLSATEVTRAVSFAASGPMPPRRASERFAMAAIIATPYIEPPAPSGDGLSLAYLTREAENRNVYFLRVGEKARRLVNYPDDDGRDLSAVTVSKHGGAVAYVRGGRVNRHGDSPNPRSDPDLPEQQVWIVATDNDAPRFLAAGSDPIFTPDDRCILWRSNGMVMAAELNWSGHRLLGVGEPVPFLFGAHTGMRFSPDGRKVAYERGSAIEVRELAARTTVMIPHGTDVDLGPVWSPDSQRLVFRREPSDSPGLERNWCGGGERYCGPMRSEQPWALWTVALSDLVPHRIWQARTGVGSVYYPLDQRYSPGQFGDELFWSADDRIAFVWEGDGWRHLYSVPAAGGGATLLTPGDGEVETAAISVDRTRLLYATNIGDLGRRHISSVGFDGSAARAVTGGDRSQWSPVPLAAGRLAYLGAGWADPPQLSVREASGTTRGAGLPQALASFPGKLLVRPELVEFPGSDGQRAFGQLFVPDQPNGCAIIFSHGGIRRQMLPGFHYMEAYHYLYDMNQYLAGRGCIVLSVEYRSSIMRGEAFRNAPGWGFTANSEILDFVGGAHYLMARKDVDATRGVGMYGLSWGGYMTAEALALHSDLFKVGFDMAGVHTAPDPAGFAHSAVGQLDGWTSPLLLMQGDDDMNVNFNDGIVLARALQTRRPQVQFVQHAVPGQTHDLYQTYRRL